MSNRWYAVAQERQAEIERLTADLKATNYCYQFMSHQVDAKCEVIESLTAELDQAHQVIADVVGWFYTWEDSLCTDASDRLWELIKPEALKIEDTGTDGQTDKRLHGEQATASRGSVSPQATPGPTPVLNEQSDAKRRLTKI